jgi:hypothetical protein
VHGRYKFITVQGEVEATSEHGNESSGCINVREHA